MAWLEGGGVRCDLKGGSCTVQCNETATFEYKSKYSRGFSHVGPSIWNSLPSFHIRNATNNNTY